MNRVNLPIAPKSGEKVCETRVKLNPSDGFTSKRLNHSAQGRVSRTLGTRLSHQCFYREAVR